MVILILKSAVRVVLGRQMSAADRLTCTAAVDALEVGGADGPEAVAFLAGHSGAHDTTLETVTAGDRRLLFGALGRRRALALRGADEGRRGRLRGRRRRCSRQRHGQQ